ncbi:uncharacterized protein LOC144094614 [Amblyomma americanum]
MALTALLLIALLLPGCVLSLPNGQVDQGPQRGLLEALQKLRLLNLANGRQQNRRYANAPAQHQQSQQVLVDIPNRSQNVSVFPDLDSLLRNRLKRDQSLMVQINVFNSAGRGCWHRRTALPSSTLPRAEANVGGANSVLASALTEIPTQAVPMSVGLEEGKVPWVQPGIPSVIPPIDQHNTSSVDYNAAANVAIENVTAGAPELDSAIQNVQGEKDVIHNIPVPSSSFVPAPSYSGEAAATPTEELSQWRAESGSRITPEAVVWKHSNAASYPKQSFEHYPAKPPPRIPIGPMTVRFGLPPPLIKVTVPVLMPSEDYLYQSGLDAVTDNPSEPEGDALNDPSGCLQSFSVGLNCGEKIYRGKASGVSSSPFDNLIRKGPAPVERRNMDRSVGAAKQLCECSDTNNSADKNKNGFNPSDVQALLFKPRGDALQRLRPQLQQNPPAKILGSLRYPPPNDIAYEYATTYVYEDYVPSAYYEAQPQPQPLPLRQSPPQQPGQAPSRQQPQPLRRLGVSPLTVPGGSKYQLRNATKHVPGALAVDHKPRRLKSRNGTRTSASPLKRIARDLQALEVTPEGCPCASSRKPPCTKTPKKCAKKRPCTKKLKKCKKRCRKKTGEPGAVSVPVTF